MRGEPLSQAHRMKISKALMGNKNGTRGSNTARRERLARLESDPMTQQTDHLIRFTFTDYQAATEETAIYPESGTGSVLALAYVGLGLGEAGEIQGKIKKVLRDSGGQITPQAREAILAEVGDLLWYCARVCRELGTSLAHVAMGNLQKLTSRKNRGVLQGSGDDR